VFSATFLAYTRSVCAAYFCGAALGCALSVKVIKIFVRQPRPPGVTTLKSYGMPSTHSAVVFFYAGTMVLASTTLPIHSSLLDVPDIRVWPPVVAAASAVVIASSRVWRGHHDFLQIAAGSLYGAVCSVIVYKMWTGGLDAYGHSLEIWLDAFMGWR